MTKSQKSSKRSRAHYLAVAALAGQAPGAQAQTASPQPEVRLQYYFYQDWQEGPDGDRMEINNPTAFVHVPIDDEWTAQATFTHDTLSGATPLYLDTLTGASGVGVGDQRWSGNLSVIRSYENFDLIIGGDYSEEQDYKSIGGSFQANIMSEDRNTTLAVGLSASTDDITATNDPTLDEHRATVGGLVGITQVINQRSILQSNLTFSTSDGFLTDQYKLSDNRPESRDQWAWLTRYALYFPETKGALHIDYRFFLDSWEVLAHMLEVQWYQELGSSFMLRPLLRFHTQSNAQFYQPLFPPLNDSFYTADQRMAALGSVAGGLKLEYAATNSIDLQVLYEIIARDNGLRIGGEGSPALETFYAHFMGAGITYRW